MLCRRQVLIHTAYVLIRYFYPEAAAEVCWLISLPLVGNGMNFSSSAAAGLISAVGMVLLANRVRLQAATLVAEQAALMLSGLKIGTSAGNTPVLSEAVGTVVVNTEDVCWRYPS